MKIITEKPTEKCHMRIEIPLNQFDIIVITDSLYIPKINENATLLFSISCQYGLANQN